ncbi:PREDICTED: band 4.1-like protein 5 [Nicrophorus vespilloides]|uniref:Band 4.1-like protein 5 n=1 Tax=Nicrophorus vespilloides TaxID=110193 RepID=A0ABM1MSC7_NICVS|nr:PREDICTED: band 4.1-like protein 5 [Nicrophorus vespilloides]
MEKSSLGVNVTLLGESSEEHLLPLVDPTKSIKKQIKIGPPYTLRLKVKFYLSDPNNLREELTRYQFFLQLKHDILDGRVDCPHQSNIELAVLALQCKLLTISFMLNMILTL